jgi:exodeoxyribonuclease VII large subunit
VDAGAQRLEVLRAHLAHLSPEAVLERGYSIARTASGEVVRDSRSLQPGDRLDVTFARGRAETTVLGTSGDC